MSNQPSTSNLDNNDVEMIEQTKWTDSELNIIKEYKQLHEEMWRYLNELEKKII